MECKREKTLATCLPWQVEPWRYIERLAVAGHFPHAMLIAGPPGIGKYHFTQAIAHYLLCQQPEQGTPCGRCRPCQLNLAATHPDLYYLEPVDTGKQITVDQVREAIVFLNQTSQQAGMKIAFIAPATALNTYAANALLKTLEEPTDNTLLLLATDMPGQLLPTIRSRCQLLQLALPNKQVAIDWLTPFAEQSKSMDVSRVEALLVEASGQPLTALSMLKSGGIATYQAWDNDFFALVKGETNATKLAEKWLNADSDTGIKGLLIWLYKRLLAVIRYRVASVAIASTWAALTILDQQRLFALADKVLWMHSKLLEGATPNLQLLLETLLLESCGVLRLKIQPK